MQTDDIISPQRKQEVEEFGVFFESTGLSPMDARVFSLLLLADPPELDFTSIWTVLSASKSSVSISLRRLTDQKKVVSYSKSGSRKRYFKADLTGWLEAIQVSLTSANPLAKVLDQVTALRPVASDSDFVRQLARLRDFLLFLDEEIATMKKRWDNRPLN